MAEFILLLVVVLLNAVGLIFGDVLMLIDLIRDFKKPTQRNENM